MGLRFHGLFLAGIVSMLLPSREVAAGPDGPVAVFDLEAKGVRLGPMVGDRLTDILSSLIAARGYQVVPRSEIRQRLVQQKRSSQKQCYDASCQIEIGKELAAAKSLTCQLIKVGRKCRVALTLFDLKKATSERGAYEAGECSEDAIVHSMEVAVRKMIDRVGVPPAAAPPESQTKAASPAPVVSLPIVAPSPPATAFLPPPRPPATGDLQPRRSAWSRWWVWTLVGVATVGAGVGLALALSPGAGNPTGLAHVQVNFGGTR